MHRLVLDINDESIMDKIIYFLNQLPRQNVKIVKEERADGRKSPGRTIDFSKYRVDAFKEIKDPVAWQRALRNEWE